VTTTLEAILEPLPHAEPRRVIAPPGGDEWAVLGGLRFLLAMIVFLGHTGDLNGAHFSGWPALANWMVPEAAVMAFLMVSGYSMAHSIEKPRGFYRRRLRRIWPLYITGLALGWLIISVHGMVIMPGGQRIELPSWLSLLRNLFFLQGWNAYPLLIDGPLWSISVEVVYYALTPIFVRLRPWALGLLIIVSGAWFLDLSNPISWQLHGRTMPGLAWAWLLGFYWYRYRSEWLRIVVLGIVCGLTISRYQRLGPVTAVVGMALTASAPQLILPRQMYRILNYLGELSYPLYTLHWPTIIGVYAFFKVTEPTIWVGATFVVTLAAYHGIDRLFRRRRPRPRPQNITAALPAQGAPI
jgi:peptidoglycan/LPS O-acetylase OafA/YrhL